MLIIKSIQSGIYRLVEYTETGLNYTKIDEDFALCSKIKLVEYEGDMFIWNWWSFAMSQKP